MSKVTLVTGLWNLGRSELHEGWSRSYGDHYLKHFTELLKIPVNLIIYGEKEVEEVVWAHRDRQNTVFVQRSKSWFKNEFYERIQNIRKDPTWIQQASWLENSTQAQLELYNPVVMSKMFLLNDARHFDSFESSHLFWIDAGLTNTVGVELLQNSENFNYLAGKLDKFLFINYPYTGNREIHGFDYESLNKIAGRKVFEVSRGGFFGGPKQTVSYINSEYYSLLDYTLSNGKMGTEESIFSILTHKFPESIKYYLVKEDGLIFRFFEALNNRDLVLYDKAEETGIFHNPNKFAVYVLTYNSPKQFETLCKSFYQYDSRLMEAPEKYLLNNSTDQSSFKEYEKLCKKYQFAHIKKDNLGICGGRQFIAEHFNSASKCDYYMFFEDDMFFYTGEDLKCKLGFTRKVDHLCSKSLQICTNENLDFLKLNFTEFFGDNRYQWAWQNIPESTRSALFPKNKIRTTGTLKEVPKTVFHQIGSYKQLTYVLGEIYYCNWPQIVSREGNRKMFLDKKWEHPTEQAWMSHIYQETVKGNIKPGLLLATPTEHDRFDHYPKEDRKEN